MNIKEAEGPCLKVFLSGQTYHISHCLEQVWKLWLHHPCCNNAGKH